MAEMKKSSAIWSVLLSFTDDLCTETFIHPHLQETDMISQVSLIWISAGNSKLKSAWETKLWTKERSALILKWSETNDCLEDWIKTDVCLENDQQN